MKLTDKQFEAIIKVLNTYNIDQVFNTSNITHDPGVNVQIEGIKVFLCEYYGYANIVNLDEKFVDKLENKLNCIAK